MQLFFVEALGCLHFCTSRCAPSRAFHRRFKQDCNTSCCWCVFVLCWHRYTVSRARIIGGPQLFVNAGSRLNVSCVVDAPGGGTDFVFWSHNNGILSLDARRDQLAIILNTDPLRQQTISSLVIRSVQTSDSGNYTCTPSNAEQDSIQLVVLNSKCTAVILCDT